MKPFCTLGYGQTSFCEPAMPAKDTACLVPQPCPSHEGLTERSLPGKGFCEHPCLSSSQIWHCSWLLQTAEILVFNQYPSELPQLAFTRANLDICEVHWHWGFAVISLFLFFPLELKEIWQLLKVFVSVSLIFLSFVLSL